MKSPVAWLTDQGYQALPLGERGLIVASTQTGVRETGGPNRGAVVQAYQRAAGVAPGSPWCAAFVYWCLLQAGGEPADFLPRGRAGSVFSWREWAVGTGRTVPDARRGRLFYWLNRRGRPRQWLGHIGYCTNATNAEGVFGTIEGNTDGGEGSREGDGVYRRTRTMADMARHEAFGFIDLGARS